jgi:hypothetical protein
VTRALSDDWERMYGDKRTGTFTSGIVSMVGAWTIALFFYRMEVSRR